MLQARTNVTGDAETKYPPNPLVCTTSPHGTLTNCSAVTEFLGMRMSCWQDAGVDFDNKDGHAVWLILNCISEALEWEAERVQYKRKTEAELAVKASQVSAAGRRAREEVANG